MHNMRNPMDINEEEMNINPSTKNRPVITINGTLVPFDKKFFDKKYMRE
jgi:hypothetical protein